MSKCAVCGLVDPREPCFHNIVDSAVLSDPELLAIQSKAAKAIDWLYWLNQGETPKAPICSFEEMKQAIGWFENQDPVDNRTRAADALTGFDRLTGSCRELSADDPFASEALRRVSKAVGISKDKAREYIECLEKGQGVEEGNIVKVEWGHEMHSFGKRQCWWKRCSPSKRPALTREDKAPKDDGGEG
jgi:hypothetical protein